MSVWVQKKYRDINGSYSASALLVILTFFFFDIASAQDKIWFDKDHKEIEESKGIYYRITPEKKKSGYYFIVDYYKDGSKYREGKAESLTIGRERFVGMIVYYFNNGTTAKKERYRKGILDGVYKEYYPSGELKVDGNYDKGYKEGVWKFYQKTGKIKTRGKYKNGEKVGIWKTFYKNLYYPDDE